MGLKLLDLVDIALPSLAFLDPQTLFDTTAPSSSSDTASTIRGTGGSSSSGPILLDASGRQIIQSKKTTTSLDTQEVEQQKQSNRDNNALFRTFLLGGSSALVASPCATPVLTSILAYVANTMAITESSVTSSSSSSALLSTIGSTVVGGVLLFGYTLGYSTPLLIVAATSGQALVRLKQNQHQSQHISDSGDDPSSNSYQERSSISSFFNSIPNQIAPWVTPITGGILLYLGTTGLLVSVIGDPSLSGLTIIE
jgi:cytochrome c-type biogenesis protein